MAKKKGRSKERPAPKPKSLHKQLRKAEAALQKAAAKRDRAQARVDALSIIADEIRAQLAEVEKVEDGKDAKPAPPTARGQGQRRQGRGVRGEACRQEAGTREEAGLRQVRPPPRPPPVLGHDRDARGHGTPQDHGRVGNRPPAESAE